MRTLRIRLRRGDFPSTAAACLVTPANDSLVGTLQPLYWRFIDRKSADGALRKLGGPDLERACLAIEPLPEGGIRRDITRWTTGCKEGASAPVRCPAGSAVVTKAAGQLRCDHVVHAVAPDSEFGYEGLYTGSDRDREASGVSVHSAALDVESRHKSWQQFSPPDQLLLAAYRAAYSAAEEVGASDAACAALGSGVKGWRHTISAAFALEAAAGLVAPSAEPPPASSLKDLQFVIGGYEPIADKAWRAWSRVALSLLGPPSGLEDPTDFREAAALGDLCWELSAASLRPAEETGSLLPLLEVSDVREMLRNRTLGYSGAEIPLTPEQELRAVRRRIAGPASP